MARLFSFAKPGLLVSVRSATEARAAVSAGADIIDIKEPRNGSLGAALPSTMRDVVATVAGRAIVTAAMGELTELEHARKQGQFQPVVTGVMLFKIGLSGCRGQPSWRAKWQAINQEVSNSSPSSPRPVAVIYADWQASGCPEPLDVLDSAIELGCPALLIDTWNKSCGNLFDHWPEENLAAFIRAVRAEKLSIVLAGSLSGEHLARAAAMLPDLLAVRGAACDTGRDGNVSAARIKMLKSDIAALQNRRRKIG